MTLPMTNTMFKTATVAGLLMAATFALPGAASADMAAARALADTACAACHGKDGNTPIDPSYPRIAGQYRDYLERALLDYKTGARKNPIMAAQTQPLSRADIANLARYYASLPGVLRTGRP
jgi:cytochrome c553